LLTHVTPVLLLGAAVCCAAASDNAPQAGGAGGAGAAGGFGGSGASGFGGGSTAGSGGGIIGDAGPAPPPPEQEVENAFEAPVATTRFIWSANPQSSRVALVNAETLEVRVLDAGFGPTYLTAVPAAAGAVSDAAIVLNVLSHDATLFRMSGTDVQQVTLPTHPGANSWAVSPGGRWAIAWSDARTVKNPDPTQGFQEITVLSLASGSESSTRLTVGYRPTQIAFSADETRAFAITEPGIGVIALDGAAPSVAALLEVTDNPLEDPASRDVSVTPDGKTALVRRDGSMEVGFVSLDSGARSAVALPSFVTDLDLSPDGTLAVAVMRLRSEVALIPVSRAAPDSGSVEIAAVPGEDFGSVALSEDASVALLYTTGTPSDRVTILDLAGEERLSHRTVSVKAPVTAVFPAANAEHAIVLMSPPAGSTKAGAFAVIPTAAALAPKIVGTDAPAKAVAIEPPPNSARALVTVRDDASRDFGVYVVQLPTLQVDRITLASPPLATGIVPSAGTGYVAQLYPEGRITFVDLENGQARTLTGFELGAKVVD
jgi:hypothetical protein